MSIVVAPVIPSKKETKDLSIRATAFLTLVIIGSFFFTVYIITFLLGTFLDQNESVAFTYFLIIGPLLIECTFLAGTILVARNL